MEKLYISNWFKNPPKAKKMQNQAKNSRILQKNRKNKQNKGKKHGESCKKIKK